MSIRKKSWIKLPVHVLLSKAKKELRSMKSLKEKTTELLEAIWEKEKEIQFLKNKETIK